MAKRLILLLALLVCASFLLSSIGKPDAGTAAPTSGPNLGGKIAYARVGDKADKVRTGGIWLYSEGQNKQLTPGPDDDQDKVDAFPSISPDGTQLAYTRIDEGFSDIYKLDIARPTRPVALTDHRPSLETGAEGYNKEALWANFPSWSPNGNRIVYTSDVGFEYPALFRMDANGGNRVRLDTRLDYSQQTVERPLYSPDGEWIAVGNYLSRNGKAQIWVLNLEEGRWFEVTNADDGAYDPAWSPDGQWLAFTMRVGTASNIYVVPAGAESLQGDFSTPVQLTTDNSSRSPAWSPDGSYLAYLSIKDASFDLYVAEVGILGNGVPGLQNTRRITENFGIDAPSGLSWGR